MNRLQRVRITLRSGVESLRDGTDASDRMAVAGWLAIGAGVWQWSPAAAAVVCGSLLLIAGAYGAHRASNPRRKGKDS